MAVANLVVVKAVANLVVVKTPAPETRHLGFEP